MKPYDIVSVIDATVDLIMGPSAVPAFGQHEKWVDRYDVLLGGSASIFLSQAGKLGLRAAALGRVGTDAFGRLVTEAMAQAQVCTELVLRDDQNPTGLSVILKDKDDRAILTVGGAMLASTLNDVPDGIEHQARHLHIASPYLLTGFEGAWVQLARRFHDAGGTVSLDTNWDPSGHFSGLDELLANVDVLLPNEQEAMRLGGSDDVRQAAQNLAQRVPIVAVKCGGEGALAVHGGVTVTAPARHVPAVVDSVGAGDSFDGGFLYGYLNNLSLELCLAYGCACGAGCVQGAGGTAAQPRLADIAV